MRQVSSDTVAAVGGLATTVRRSRTEDLPRIAALHRSELDHGLYPLLGERFLRRYHATSVASPYAVSASIGPVGRPDGFVVTLIDPPAHRRWLRGRAAVVLALHGCLGLLTHPDALLLFLRTRVGRYLRAMLRSEPSAATDSVRSHAPAVLLHVAVDPAARGRGLGAALVDDTLAAAAAAGCGRVRLVTKQGSAAEDFYSRLGWTRVGERAGRDGSPVTEFEHPVPSPAP